MLLSQGARLLEVAAGSGSRDKWESFVNVLREELSAEQVCSPGTVKHVREGHWLYFVMDIPPSCIRFFYWSPGR